MSVREVTGTTSQRLADWALLPADPGQYQGPRALPARGWLPASVPGTVAGSARTWDRRAVPPAAQRPDDHDWWYRTRFTTDVPAGATASLQLAGLATVADVWLDGEPIHHGDNMFTAHRVEVGSLLRTGRPHELVIRFAALTPLVARRRGRPRWRSRLVADQNLRWFRTTLLGRIPSWSPGPAPVGPWRPVDLVVARQLAIRRAELTVGGGDGAGIVEALLEVQPTGGRRVSTAMLLVAGEEFPLSVSGTVICGRARPSNVAEWLPHTHGTPAVYPILAVVHVDDGTRVDIDLGTTGFRSVGLARDPAEFGLRVNDVDVFFRGACWTPLDPVNLTATRTQYRNALRQLRDAGANMVRVCGPMCYESDAFYDCCDELGIAVWQDFMFANLDYPFGDARFDRSVAGEVHDVLDRLAAHPCVVLLCGNSEVSQQAAMLGLPPDQWSNEMFDHTLADLCANRLPAVAYWPSSPSGGPLPMHPADGDAHYQGVGAYLRDLPDAELSGVRFASETLAFANVPEPESIQTLADGGDLSVQGPRWKAGSPRDRGAGWDFDDVRDEYLQRLFQVDPLTVRYSDPDRYLALARVTSGEVMARVFAAWRAGGGRCRGGLVWFWRDLVPGAGWGVVDVYGVPKAPYHYLRRAWRPVTVFLLDRGLNGLHAAVVNDLPDTRDLVLRIVLYPRGVTHPTVTEHRVALAGRGTCTLPLERLLGGFRDLNHAYRFGPVGYDMVLAELADPGPDGGLIADDAFFPAGLAAGPVPDLGLAVSTVESGGPDVTLSVLARRPAQGVRVDVPGYRPDDNYFHLAPGRPKRVRLQPVGCRPATHGQVCALNSLAPTPVALELAATEAAATGTEVRVP